MGFGALQNKRHIDLVRLDIEEHAVDVFESIKKLAENKDFAAGILFETHFPKNDDTHHNMRKQLERLCELGYFPK